MRAMRGVLLLLLVVGCAPVMANVQGRPERVSGLRTLPPGQVARRASVALERVAGMDLGDTLRVRAQWTIPNSLDSIQVVTAGWGGLDSVTYRATSGPLPTSQERRFLLPLDQASVAGHAWTCIVTFRGELRGGETYGETETADNHQSRQNCSAWTPYSFTFSAPLASGVTITVEKIP